MVDVFIEVGTTLRYHLSTFCKVEGFGGDLEFKRIECVALVVFG